MTNHPFLLKLRQKHNWTQAEIAKIMAVSRPTYIALEKGSTSITIDQVGRLADKLGCEPMDIISQDIIDEDKYRQVLLETIRQGADADGKIPKTKLAKLIYLNDFSWFYQHLESMTGAKYRRLQLGPVPNIYFTQVEELVTDGSLNLEIKNGCQMISLSRAGQMSKPNLLNSAEKTLIKKIAVKWQGKRTEEIVKFTHEQLPYKICNPGEVIPYELITQQDPDYVY